MGPFGYICTLSELDEHFQGFTVYVSAGLTLQLSLRWTADAILPQDGRVVHKGELQLRLQVKVLPAPHGHGRVEDVGHVERDAQRNVRLHQVQHLRSGKHGWVERFKALSKHLESWN